MNVKSALAETTITAELTETAETDSPRSHEGHEAFQDNAQRGRPAAQAERSGKTVTAA